MRPSVHPAIVPIPFRGLIAGDVIRQINGVSVADRDETLHRLLAAADTGEPLTLAVRRGLPSPFASHPRLELFVGSASPHPQAVFGCTVCHEGQGSATDFKWASHTPNDAAQRRAWRAEHRWFDNPDWIFPMYPRRFAESACLKCHREMGELAPSERFADPPAPKLSRGYQLILAHGCFGCHDLSGYRSQQRVGPDLRTEPNYAAVAQQLKHDPRFAAWDATQQADVEQLIQNPERDAVRRRIREQLLADAAAGEPRFTHETQTRLVPLLKDVEQPGSLRRVGPSLRSVARKLDQTFLYDWIRQPNHFRPDTRMPQVFGLWNHLDGQGKSLAERYEPLEILGMVSYLQARSQQFAYIEPPAGITASSSQDKLARGKVLFQERGCLACHRHGDFADAEPYRDPEEVVLGPDLSAIAHKFTHAEGRQWLYSWIQQPTRYDPRTLMPETFLDPVPRDDGSVFDPIDDLVEYMLASSTSDWQPAPSTLAYCSDLDAEQLAALDEVTSEHLRDTFSHEVAAEFLRTGIPASHGRRVERCRGRVARS